MSEARLTIEERMDQWLNKQADESQVADEDRQRFIDAMRGTHMFAATQLDLAWRDLIEDSRIMQFLDWLNRKLTRREGAA